MVAILFIQRALTFQTPVVTWYCTSEVTPTYTNLVVLAMSTACHKHWNYQPFWQLISVFTSTILYMGKHMYHIDKFVMFTKSPDQNARSVDVFLNIYLQHIFCFLGVVCQPIWPSIIIFLSISNSCRRLSVWQWNIRSYTHFIGPSNRCPSISCRQRSRFLEQWQFLLQDWFYLKKYLNMPAICKVES